MTEHDYAERFYHSVMAFISANAVLVECCILALLLLFLVLTSMAHRQKGK